MSFFALADRPLVVGTLVSGPWFRGLLGDVAGELLLVELLPLPGVRGARQKAGVRLWDGEELGQDGVALSLIREVVVLEDAEADLDPVGFVLVGDDCQRRDGLVVEVGDVLYFVSLKHTLPLNDVLRDW